MCQTKKIALAKVLKPHALSGALKIRVFTDDLARFKRQRAFFVNGVLRRVTYFKPLALQSLIVKFEGIESLEAAQQCRNALLLLSEEQLASHPSTAPLITALLGMRVFSNKGVFLGVVQGYREAAPSSVSGGRGFYQLYSSRENKERLLPVEQSFFKEIDTKNGLLTLNCELV